MHFKGFYCHVIDSNFFKNTGFKYTYRCFNLPLV